MSRKPVFVSAVVPPAELPGETLVFAFSDRRLLVEGKERARVLALRELEDLTAGGQVAPLRRQYLGRLEGCHLLSIELGDVFEPPQGLALHGLRSLFGSLPDELFWIAARAIQIVDWDRDHQFCGRCGTGLEPQLAERSKRCPVCRLVAYPRISPAVIVLVRRGEEVLLARSPHFLPGMYSCLAGFVEPGETLEQAVEREVREETGIEVENVRYFGSQPWPFPNSLMIGFLADYSGGEITLDDPEIEDAGWYRADAMPQIPPRISIARALIDSFLLART